MGEKEMTVRLYQEVLSGKIKRFPNYFFRGDQGKIYLAYITRYLIEEYLKIPIERIPKEVKAETLWDHRLRPAAHALGWRDFMKVIDNAYPGKYHILEFNQVPWRYWCGDEGRERAIKVLKDVIENKFQIPQHEIPEKLNHHFFKKNQLGGIFSAFNDSPYKIIDAVYPGRFQPWELRRVPSNFWGDAENIKRALDWFLFKKLGFISYEEANEKIRKEDFTTHQFTGFFQGAFNSRVSNVREFLTDLSNSSYNAKKEHEEH